MKLRKFSELVFSRTATRIFWLSAGVASFLLIKFIAPGLDFHTHERGFGIAYFDWLVPILTAFVLLALLAATIGFSRLIIAFVIPWWRRDGA